MRVAAAALAVLALSACAAVDDSAPVPLAPSFAVPLASPSRGPAIPSPTPVRPPASPPQGNPAPD